MRLDTICIKNGMLQLTIIASVFSQITPIENVMRPLMYVGWICIVGYAVATTGESFRISFFAKSFIFCYVLYALIQMMNSLLFVEHSIPNYLRILIVPLLVSIVGNFYIDLTEREIQSFIRTYIFCALIYAIWAQLTYFPSYSIWLKSLTYAFATKNSAAQIWISSMLLLMVYVDYRNNLYRILGYISAAYFFIISAISQCRTALLAVAIVVCVYALLKAKRKFIVIFMIMGVAIIGWNIPYINDFIQQALFLNKYQGTDINTFSSGRLDLWKEALRVFSESPIIGVGNYYVDCSYISILTESGVIGFILIEYVWICKLVSNFKYRDNEKRSILLFCMSIFYIIESLLEGFPPFGPGVSSFMFWLLSELFIGQKDIRDYA